MIDVGLKRNQGQSVVEYIFLVAVVVILTTSILKNKQLRGFLGSDSEYLGFLKNYIESTYQFGQYSAEKKIDYNGGKHDAYISAKDTHFYTPDGSQ